MALHSRGWIPRALAASFIYVAIGVGFGTLAGAAGQTPARTVWRAAAFLLSGIIYGAHLALERKTARVLASSLHVAVAVAIGAFGLALSANVHSLSVETANRALLRMSLVIWPLMTGLPAFVVALAATTLGNRLLPTPMNAASPENLTSDSDGNGSQTQARGR